MKVPRLRGLDLLKVSKRSVKSFLEHEMPTYARPRLALRRAPSLLPVMGAILVDVGRQVHHADL